mgnify:CR=1 FL=1|jgi:hypothetical protein|tara:strand:- start:244 stop:441 length:198 start_codon:yes stop_codon:yes gene_type:complete
MGLVDDIIAYENGEMEWDRIVDFFQQLIDSGHAWTLQGSYGRMAQSLIDDGECHLPQQGEQKNES